MDSFFKQRFNASKCKTLLKLTIPRIKLLRNRREIHLKQMRRDIAKLLETGQEATARIRVEHIIREEKMMAAQEIVELFCELVSVRLPIIEAQRECPLDLKEAISSICFAAPRCADLPELLQVQMLFAGKYGKEFVSAATELMPECGVNRQIIELLSIRAPAPDVKLKLLKEIAEEHQLDWDPSPSEKELLKPHEDLLNGPTQYAGGPKFTVPNEKVDETITTPQPATQGRMNDQTQFVSGSRNSLPDEKVDEGITTQPAKQEQSDSDEDFDIVDFPDVPKQPLQLNKGSVSSPQMLPFPASALSEIDDQEEQNLSEFDENLAGLRSECADQKKSITPEDLSKLSAGSVEPKQFLPFMSPPSQSSEPFSIREHSSLSSTNIKVDNLDLQDVLAAAQAAAESAERAAAAARSAASIAQLRISELVNRNNDEVSGSTVENPFHVSRSESDVAGRAGVDKQNSFSDSGSPLTPASQHNDSFNYTAHQDDSSPHGNHNNHQPQRLPSMDDEYFSYPNLFNSQGSNLSRPGSFKDYK